MLKYSNANTLLRYYDKIIVSWTFINPLVLFDTTVEIKEYLNHEKRSNLLNKKEPISGVRTEGMFGEESRGALFRVLKSPYVAVT